VYDQSSLSLERSRTGAVARGWRGWPAAFVSIWALLAIAFVLLPWPVEAKGVAVLHGLCAQQPTHTIYFGEQRLPFDARMTGIYGASSWPGAAVAGAGASLACLPSASSWRWSPGSRRWRSTA